MAAPRTAPLAALLVSVALAAGCTSSDTAPDPTPVTAEATGSSAATEQRAESGAEGWATASPQALGMRPGRLRDLAREAREMDSSCYAVVRRGTLARDWSWGTPREAPREVFSITKSVASALVGIAVRDGDLRLDDRVSQYVSQWRGTPSEDVTVRHLLANDSGRYWTVDSDYGDLVGSEDRSSYAVDLSQQHRPGRAWAYNNAAIQVLEPVLEEATGVPVADYARDRLFEPLGMAHSRLVTDTAGSTMVFFGLQSTCLDLARFGLLYLGGGEVDGTRLLSESYVRRSVGRPSTVHNAAYGLLWWLNRPGPLRGATDEVDVRGQPVDPVTGQLAPGAPSSLYAALGLGGQTLLVDPTTDTVVVRLGRPAQGGEPDYAFSDAAKVVTTALRR